MNTSGYAKIDYRGSGVRVYYTDEKVIEWILQERKKYIPSYRTVGDNRQLISGEVYEFWIDKLQSKDEIVAFWILKQLVLRGWEPFQIRGGFPNISDSEIHLKLIVKDTE